MLNVHIIYGHLKIQWVVYFLMIWSNLSFLAHRNDKLLLWRVAALVLCQNALVPPQCRFSKVLALVQCSLGLIAVRFDRLISLNVPAIEPACPDCKASRFF